MADKKIWGDKPYYSLSHYLKETFGGKIYKLSLNGGMTCPNRDGTLGQNGCIFCSKGGSGDFSSSPYVSITQQIEDAKQLVKNKISTRKHEYDKNHQGQYIAYFQAYTNTYGPIEYLREIFTEAINHPEIVALSIATRPDCLGQDVLELIEELNKIKPVWVELGLQSCHEKTATFIRRGYSLDVFEDAVSNLYKRGITIIVHVIIGLPIETKDDMIATITYLSKLPIHGIKLQLLHVLKDTDLALYADKVLTMDEYINIIIESIELLPQNIVIHRITGDGPKDQLIGPMWSGNKKLVLNTIHQQFKLRNTWQGKHI